jgi:hypothetical protein
MLTGGIGAYFWVADTGNHRVQLFQMSYVAIEAASWAKIKSAYR